MNKKYTTKGLHCYRSYTIVELSEIINIHPDTIRRWMKTKQLNPVGNNTPYLFYGQDIIDFIKKNNQKNKITLSPGEAMCLACNKAVSIKNPHIEQKENWKIGKSSKPTILLSGLCSICHRKVNCYISKKTYEGLRGVL